MKKTLNFKQTLLVGSLLFGLFFGAGNLIFPLKMGQDAGYNIGPVTLGFLLSGVGLPILGVVAAAMSDSQSLFNIAIPTGKKIAYFFTILLYLTIGPGFAIPRTSTVSYEVSFASFSINQSLGLFIFSLIFFALALHFALNKGKLIDTIGKYLTPIFLILLGILVLLGLFKPMGPIGTIQATDNYVNAPFLKGVIDGYNTLDAPASLAFAVIIIGAIRSFGLEDPQNIAKQTLKSGLVCFLAMGLVYVSLAMLGAGSTNIMEPVANGAIILAEIIKYYLGDIGHILLSLIVIVACLKTSIGLISACSEMFSEMLSFDISYEKYCYIFAIISFAIANLGLERIISLSLPVLLFLYPLSIVLIILSMLSVKIGKNEIVYKWTIGFTAFAAIFDLLKASPFAKSDIIVNILKFPENFMPGFDLGFAWIMPAAIGFAIGIIIDKTKKNSKISKTTGE